MASAPHQTFTSNTKVLVTGGAGYIGSTICNALADSGFTPIILDNLYSGPEAFTKNHVFYKGDIADTNLINKIFQDHGPISYAIHCAALIVVGESVSNPESYYHENVTKSLTFFAALRDLGCKKIVFSSSAAVYGSTDGGMVTEDSEVFPSSPYSRTKYMMELILEDFCKAYDLEAIALRYFNPVGADPLMRTGPYVKNPSHILGRMLASAKDKSIIFEITGTNWPTRDGTGVRDYIHVWDLALAHVAAIQKFEKVFGSKDSETGGFKVINLGTGKGVTVKEFVNAFERITGIELNKKESLPRPGDVAGSFANANTAKDLIGWIATRSIDEGISDALNWNKKYFS